MCLRHGRPSRSSPPDQVNTCPPPELPPKHLQCSRSCVPSSTPHSLACCWHRVRKVTEFGNLLSASSGFTLFNSYHSIDVPPRAAKCPSVPQRAGASGSGRTWHGASVPSPPWLQGRGGGRLLAGLPVLQLSDIFQSVLFCPLRACPVVVGRVAWPESGAGRPHVVVPVRPLITLLLRLLFTFVLLYIGL